MFAASKTASVSGGYQISRSLRFNSADSAYLNRTPASAGNRRTWTWSGWVKRSTLNASGSQSLFDVQLDAPNFFTFYIRNDTVAYDMCHTTSGNRIVVGTTAVYRDVSAWYHFVLAVDTTNATAANRIRAYVNGSEVILNQYALGSGYVAQNADLAINSTSIHSMGRRNDSGGDLYLPAYMTEVNFIDGQALTPSSFGETNAQTGVWQPKAYSGSYGTNGFYLNFSDNSNTTAATLGKDYSGNGNNWTPNNFSVSAGAGNDSLVDSPTSYGTDTGVGGTVRGNYATLNPLDSAVTLSNGNLDFQSSGVAVQGSRSTFAIPSGIKVYAECWFNSWTTGTGNYAQFGVATSTASMSSDIGAVSGTGFSIEANQSTNVVLRLNGTAVTISGAITSGDVFQIAVDLDNLKVWLGRNNTWYDSSGGTTGNPATGANATGTLSSGITYFPVAVKFNTANNQSVNFGQRPFAYTAPSGFKALCTQNLPTPTIGATTATQAGKYFNPVLYTGNGSTQSITGVGFQPDMTWIKVRSTTYDHQLVDAVRGSGKVIHSNLTNAEATLNTVTSFNSDGFTVNGTTYAGTNGNGSTFVAWNWKANGSGSTNTSGSITSTVSANTTSGFSIVTYTGNGTGGATVGHGLGVAPSMMIIKRRSTTASWVVYHASLGATKGMYLDLTDSVYTGSTFWYNTAPSSSVFTLGTVSENNVNSSTYVAYCFAEVAGYSKMGSYTGNGSADGPFVYCGFRPRYIMVKCSTENIGPGSGWHIIDTARSTYNAAIADLFANASYDEATIGTSYPFDIISNGFKVRNNNSYVNNVGQTYIFAAFAESPFKYSLAR